MAQRTRISALRRSRLMPVPFVIILCMCATLNSVVGQELLGATAYARVWLRVSDAGVSCAGDCNTDGQVTVDEILTMVNIALGSADVSTCMAGDANHDDEVTIDEILTAVSNALNKCPMSGSVGPEGGQVQGPGGLVVTFPPGSVSSTVGVQIASVDAETLPSQVTSALQQAAMTFVLAFHFDTGGVILQTPVQFSAPNAADIPPGPALVLQLMTSTSGAASAAALSSAGTPAFLVDIAEITNAGITGGQPPFPGITTSGTFIVAGPPSGTTSLFGHGFVTDAAGLAVAKAVVQNLSTPFSSVTGSDGGYVLYLGSVDALNLPTSATIVAEYPLSSSAGVLNWVIPWITPIPGGA